MPVCCAPTRIQFTNEAITTIAYTQQMRDMYGVQPKVYVYYYDPITLEFVLSILPLTSMRFDGNTLTIDHGGLSNGIVVVT